MASLWLIPAILVMCAAGWAFRFALPWRLRPRFIAWLLCSLAAGLSPCLVPLTILPVRFFAAMLAIAVLAKLYDFHRQPLRAQALPRTAYALHIINLFWLVLRFQPPSVPASLDRRLLASNLPLALAMFAANIAVFSRDYVNVPFAIEHVLKVTILIAVIVPFVNAAAAIWRLLGGAALNPMLHPQLARTPADFWRRWNRPAQQFFYEYGFRPADGPRRPVRGAVAAFALSGVVHEYVFGIAVGQIQGWQFAFFMLEGLAAAATLRLRPRGWLAVPCIAATLAFNLTLAVLFFQSVNAVTPFYSPRDH